jgi:hypothetical protein
MPKSVLDEVAESLVEADSIPDKLEISRGCDVDRAPVLPGFLSETARDV